MISAKHLPHKIPGEEIVQVVRRDIFIIFKKVLLVLLMAILPLIFYALAGDFIFSDEPAYALVVLGSSAYYLFVLMFALFCFIDYYLDVWIITNERILDIEQRGYFSRIIAEHKIYRIQDVTSETHGVVSTLLKFGDVHIQTAGAKQRFMFHQVPDPDKIRQTIVKLVEASKARHYGEMKKGDLV
jgi:uncharacterized membrane protein YdbT with pleckstrin-like domain